MTLTKGGVLCDIIINDDGVNLLQGKEIYKNGRQISILEDPQGKLTIDDVSKEEYNLLNENDEIEASIISIRISFSFK